SNQPVVSETPIAPPVKLAEGEPAAGVDLVSDEEEVSEGRGLQLFQQGEQALRNRDKETALKLFRQALQHGDELGPSRRQRLQDHLQILSAGAGRVRTGEAGQSLLDTAAARQQEL